MDDLVLQVRIVADEGEVFGHPLVRQSSVLALSKFMCISGEFCERNLSLLFTTLERATDTAVRQLAVENRTNEGASISVPCMVRLCCSVQLLVLVVFLSFDFRSPSRRTVCLIRVFWRGCTRHEQNHRLETSGYMVTCSHSDEKSLSRCTRFSSPANVVFLFG